MFQFGKSMISEMVISNTDVKQTQPACHQQVMNHAGGFTFQVTDLMRVRRFLILGCEGGTYYTSERKLGMDNAACIQRMIAQGQGVDVVREIVEISTNNRAPKLQPVVFALAVCARSKCGQTQHAAYAALSTVCRIPTSLFQFIAFSELLSEGTGWSRAHKRAVAEWYTSKTPSSLAFLMTKYRQRDGWSHRDVLRLAHVKPPSDMYDMVFRYAAKGFDKLGEVSAFAEALATPTAGSVPSCHDEETHSVASGEEESEVVGERTLQQLAEYLSVVEHCKDVIDAHEMAHLIRQHGLQREHVPTPLLNKVEVWEALVEKMPMTAMIRNLGKMTSLGLLAANSTHADVVVRALRDERRLHKGRIHPFSVLLALYTYRSGHGDKGSLSWEPVPEVLSALNFAFYAAFKNVTPTGQRIVVGLDVSGSMDGAKIMGTSISAREGAAALSMLFARTEQETRVMAFCDDFVELDITGEDSLEDVLSKTSCLPFGRTDCSLPMLWALENNVNADCFIVITDNETFAGGIHPHEALKRYRELTRIDAKMVVVGMTATEFTIADPEDSGMLDMVGFDASAPEILRDFLVGRV